ncbi:MAG: hypothetical protein H7Z73_09920 [Candidatus Saccharibacteria bacterium]|nr:hypothetical protein [Moraxellaceae bacterium]
MAHDRLKAKGRREGGTFAPLPSYVLASDNFKTLSPKAKNLFLMMIAQLKFRSGGTYNNGDLCATHSIAIEWGFASKSTLNEAIKELLERGWIELTRESYFGDGRNKPNLYAMTLWAIDDCGGKLKVKPTRVASGKWKDWKPN